jgi:hypothetical protein
MLTGYSLMPRRTSDTTSKLVAGNQLFHRHIHWLSRVGNDLSISMVPRCVAAHTFWCVTALTRFQTRTEIAAGTSPQGGPGTEAVLTTHGSLPVKAICQNAFRLA